MGVQRWHPLPAPCTCQTLHSSLARCCNHGASERPQYISRDFPKQPAAFPVFPYVLTKDTRKVQPRRGQTLPAAGYPTCGACRTGCRAKQASVRWTGILPEEGYILTATVRLNQPENICAERQELQCKGSFPRRC